MLVALRRCEGHARFRALVSQWAAITRGLHCSRPRWGQDPEDLQMGERAATRTNSMLDRIEGMYVGKNFGYSKSYSASYNRVFGGKNEPADGTNGQIESLWTDVEFDDGPLGLEISWSTPPSISNVLPGSAAECAGVMAGSTILEINGRDACVPIPDLELDELMQQRPLRFRLTDRTVGNDHGSSKLGTPTLAVGRFGVAKAGGALSPRTANMLLDFAIEERQRCLHEVSKNPASFEDLFSKVQTPTSGVEGSPVTRWDMRLPLVPVVYATLQELLRGGSKSLGACFEAFAGGPEAELWELGVVVSEPGAAQQPIHFDAAERCLYTAFVALQDVTKEMGPTVFLPGTHTAVAHKRFAHHPDGLFEAIEPTIALLRAGDAVVYDSRVLHCGGANQSDRTRALMYITFRHPEIEPEQLGIEQHSIRKALAGKYRLKDFRPRR